MRHVDSRASSLQRRGGSVALACLTGLIFAALGCANSPNEPRVETSSGGDIETPTETDLPSNPTSTAPEEEVDRVAEEMASLREAIAADHAQLETFVSTPNAGGPDGLHRSPEVHALADRIEKNRRALARLEADRRAAQR